MDGRRIRAGIKNVSVLLLQYVFDEAYTSFNPPSAPVACDIKLPTLPGSHAPLGAGLID
jgi:hypothetical protein